MIMALKCDPGRVVLPGGFGTLDKLAENAHDSDQKSRPVPIITVNSLSWRGLII